MMRAVKTTGLLALACLCSAIAFAQDKPKAASIEELGAARAKALAAVQELQGLMSDPNYGPNREYAQKVNDIAYAYGKINMMLQAAVQAESAKPAESQNKVLLADCASMQAYVADRWSKYGNIEAPPLNAKMTEVYALCREGINPLAGNLMAADTPSNKLKIDLGPLRDAYAALEAKCAEMKAQMKAGVEAIAKLAAKWDEDLKNVAKLTGQKPD